MTQKQKRERMAEIVCALEQIYPDAACALNFGGIDWRLMVMARLSAQCTDARVNIVCEELFQKYPTLSSLADAPVEDIGRIVRPCGLWKTKAQNIKDECIAVRDRFGGKVPDNMEDLLSMAGVGRKIANLLLGDIHSKPSIVADTHCIRICGRFGMYPTTLKDAYKVEQVLDKIVEKPKQSDFCHRIVQFGRDTCTARSPKCSECPIKHLCEYAKKIK